MKFVVVTAIALLMAGASTPKLECEIASVIDAACIITPLQNGMLRFNCVGMNGNLYTMIYSGSV